MDAAEILREGGAAPTDPWRSYVDGFALRIGSARDPRPGGRRPSLRHALRPDEGRARPPLRRPGTGAVSAGGGRRPIAGRAPDGGPLVQPRGSAAASRAES